MEARITYRQQDNSSRNQEISRTIPISYKHNLIPEYNISNLDDTIKQQLIYGDFSTVVVVL